MNKPTGFSIVALVVALFFSMNCSDSEAAGDKMSSGVADKGITRAKLARQYRKLCDGKNGAQHAAECFLLAEMYEKGDGVRPSASRASRFYKKSVNFFQAGCDNQSVEACKRVAFIYAQGKGVEQNNAKAEDFYLRACEIGDASVCMEIVGGYYFGAGVPQSYAMAATLAKKACYKEDGYGCYMVGELYEKSQGDEIDIQTALKYYSRACELGNNVGCESYKNLKKLSK